MDEHIKMPSRALPRFIQQTRAVCLETIHRGGKIGNLNGDMMQPLPAFLDEFGDHGIGRGRFQQLDTRFSGGQHGDVHFFLLHCFAQADGESELLLVELQRLVQRANGNAEMINPKVV